MTTATVFSLSVNVAHRDVSKLISRLKRLVSTVDVSDGGKYQEFEAYIPVHVQTKKTKKELEDWLNTTGRVAYTHVFTRI